jgi:small basic protein
MKLNLNVSVQESLKEVYRVLRRQNFDPKVMVVSPTQLALLEAQLALLEAQLGATARYAILSVGNQTFEVVSLRLIGAEIHVGSDFQVADDEVFPLGNKVEALPSLLSSLREEVTLSEPDDEFRKQLEDALRE